MKSEGYGGFYKGFSASVAKFAIQKGLYFGLYDSGKSLLFND